VARAHPRAYLVFPLLALGLLGPVRRNPASPGRDGPLVPRWMGAAGGRRDSREGLLLRWPSSDWRLQDAAAEGFMDGRTDSSRKGGGCGTGAAYMYAPDGQLGGERAAKSHQQQPDALLAPAAPPAPPALWERQQCNTPSKLPAFFGRQNSGPPSTSFTIGPRFAEIRA
jgi:hypothetical protein